MRHEVIIKPAAEKNLDEAPQFARQRIVNALEELRDDPRSPGVVRLADKENLWRVRVGEYRIVYAIDNEQETVIVLRVAHRQDVYRGRK